MDRVPLSVLWAGQQLPSAKTVSKDNHFETQPPGYKLLEFLESSEYALQFESATAVLSQTECPLTSVDVLHEGRLWDLLLKEFNVFS